MDQILICRNTAILHGGSLFQIGGIAMAMQQFANFSEEVKNRRTRSVRAEEERVERSGWTVNN